MPRNKQEKILEKTMKKECNGYYEKIEQFFGLMKNNFDEKPLTILGFHGICCFLFGYIYSAIMGEDNSIYRIVLYLIGSFWGISIFFGLIYMIFAILKSRKKGKKLFALAFGTLIPLLFFGGNLLFIFWAIDEFYYFAEWIPLIVFWLLSCGWCVYMIKRIRKEIKGEVVKPLNIPFWLIVVAIGSFAPLASFSGRRNIGNWLPENLFLYYMAYLMTLFNLFSAKFVLDLLMYCKITLFGKNKR